MTSKLAVGLVLHALVRMAMACLLVLVVLAAAVGVGLAWLWDARQDAARWAARRSGTR